MINGSPRGKRANSYEILSFINGLLPKDWEHVSEEKAQDADILIIAFPLYVDALPASLMKRLEEYGSKIYKSQRVFGIANCGFYEGLQNKIALEILRRYCINNGLEWCGGVGIGTGEMITALKNVPARAGIKRPVTLALEKLEKAAEDSPSGRLAQNIYTQHVFPWMAYKLSGEMGWRQQAKRHGLKRRDLFARPLEG